MCPCPPTVQPTHQRKEQMDKRKFPFVPSVPFGATTVIPEPNFPAKPDEFVGRKPQLEAFRPTLKQGAATGRTPSFAVLGAWGIGKSSLLMKCSAICSKPEHAMLPVFFSVSTDSPECIASKTTLFHTGRDTKDHQRGPGSISGPVRGIGGHRYAHQ
jgi:hypothetical protein